MVAPSSPPAPGGVGVGSATRRAPAPLLPRAPRAHSPCPPGVILSPAQDLGSLNPTRCPPAPSCSPWRSLLADPRHFEGSVVCPTQGSVPPAGLHHVCARDCGAAGRNVRGGGKHPRPQQHHLKLPTGFKVMRATLKPKFLWQRGIWGGKASGMEMATCGTPGQAPPSVGHHEQPRSPGDPHARPVPGRGLGHHGATWQSRCPPQPRSDSAGRQASPTRRAVWVPSERQILPCKTDSLRHSGWG